MGKNKKTTILVLLLLILAVGGICANILYKKYYDHKVGNFERTSELYIYPGEDVSSVVSGIIDSCSVRKPASVRRAFKGVSSLQPGHYTVSPSASSVYLQRMLTHGWQTPVRLTLSGSMRQDKAIARKISSQMLVDSVEVLSALRDSSLLSRWGFTPRDVFSLIIPDTYEVYWTASTEEILETLGKAYDQFWTEENKAKAKAQGLTPKEVSILASIVKGETNYVPEMPSVAGVYLNRLAIGMKLQADPTLAYLLDYQVGRILNRHKEIDSPYNTYMYAGLPPGPIQVPSRECLLAVLNPDKHGYLYFCASPDFNGTHRFAVTYPEHLRNAREFQAELNRRNSSK